MKFKTNNYINPNKIASKYEVTKLVEDSDYISSMFRDILKDRSPDKCTQESEAPRKCSDTNGILDRRYGRKTENDMYAPDLFLGDLTKDPRSIMLGPDLNGMRTFMEHRKDAYAVNLLNDDDRRVHTKTMTHAEVRRAKDKVFNRVKDKYTNFSEQMVTGPVARSVKELGNMPKSEYSKIAHVSAYSNREDSGRSNRLQSAYKDMADYTIKKKDSKETSAKKSLKAKVDLRMQDTAHKEASPELTQENNKTKAMLVTNFIEKKLESLDDYKLSAKVSDSKDQKTRSQIVQSTDAQIAELESVKRHKEIVIQNRINRNSDLSNAIRDNPNLLTHKEKLNELLLKTTTSVRASSKPVVTADVLTAKDRYAAREGTNGRTHLVSKNDSVVDNTELDNKYKTPVLIYNYKTKRPERIIRSSEKSTFIETYTDRVLANTARVHTYDQIRESHREDIDHMDRSANKMSGQSGPIGSKYLRPAMIFKEESIDEQLHSNLRASKR